MSPHLKKWLRRVPLLTVAGVVLTFVSTLLCVCMSSGGFHSGMPKLPASYERWPSWLPAEWPSPTSAIEWEGCSIGYSYVEVESAQKDELRSLWRVSYGWPFKATARWDAGLRITGLPDSRDRTRAIRDEFTKAAGLRQGVDAPRWLPMNRDLGPVLPVWPLIGAALNVVFYAGVFALAVYVPGAWRRFSRARAGRCLACGYDRRGIARDGPCPECGGAA